MFLWTAGLFNQLLSRFHNRPEHIIKQWYGEATILVLFCNEDQPFPPEQIFKMAESMLCCSSTLSIVESFLEGVMCIRAEEGGCEEWAIHNPSPADCFSLKLHPLPPFLISPFQKCFGKKNGFGWLCYTWSQCSRDSWSQYGMSQLGEHLVK